MAEVGPVILITSGAMSEHLKNGLSKGLQNLVWASDTPGARTIEFETRESLRDGLAGVVGNSRPTGIAIAIAGNGSLTPTPLEQMSDGDWEDAVNWPLRRSLFVIQALHDLFPHDPPPIVFLGASTGLMGTPQLVPLATVVEGQRALAKLVSRRWGTDGWRVNWLGLSPEIFSTSLHEAGAPRAPELVLPATGKAPSLSDDVAPMLSMMFDPRARALLGSTILLDGGDWMVP